MEERVWRLLEFSAADAALNLAIDEALIRARAAGESPSTLRLWRNPPCVVIGVAQNPFEEIDLVACEALGVPVIRRQSGGGAVYHDDGNLNYSLVIEPSALGAHGGTSASYTFLLQGVVTALARFNVTASLRHTSDVYVGERKIAGCAQYRTAGAVLHHGCLLVSADLATLERTLRVPAAWYREVVNLIEIANPSPDWSGLVVALSHAYGELFGVVFEKGDLSDVEWQRAKRLYEEKYRDRAWNLRVPQGWKPGRYGPRR